MFLLRVTVALKFRWGVYAAEGVFDDAGLVFDLGGVLHVLVVFKDLQKSYPEYVYIGHERVEESVLVPSKVGLLHSKVF